MPKRIAIVEDEAELASLIDYNLAHQGYLTRCWAGPGARCRRSSNPGRI